MAGTDGVLTGLPGIEAPRGFKQQIIQWCYDAASPPIELFVSPPTPAPSDATKVCYVIYVPESEEAPHFLNSRKGVYIRADEFSQRFQALLATYDEIQHLANRHVAIVERKERLIKRAGERFDTFVAMKYENGRYFTVLGGGSSVHPCWSYSSKEHSATA